MVKRGLGRGSQLRWLSDVGSSAGGRVHAHLRGIAGVSRQRGSRPEAD
jgi:hypothetical protein